MTTNSAAHPDELLAAFSLDALSAEEERGVLAHLDVCPRCAAAVAGHLETAAALASLAPAQRPPERARARLMAAVALAPTAETPLPPTRVSVSNRRRPRGWSGVHTILGRRWGRRLIPITAVAGMMILSFIIGLNVQMSGQMGDMQAENTQLRQEMGQNQATATARLAQASDTVTQIQGNLQFLHNTLAQPGNRSLVMQPAQPGSPAQGVLVLSPDGGTGMIMASELPPPRDDAAYRVWLMRDGERILAGDLAVDERGWGALELDAAEPLSDFDAVRLYYGPLAVASNDGPGDMVLEAALP